MVLTKPNKDTLNRLACQQLHLNRRYIKLEKHTVPFKCKLTVTRNSNDSTRTSNLDPRNSNTSSIES